MPVTTIESFSNALITKHLTPTGTLQKSSKKPEDSYEQS
jgi:hypothetical protein